MKITHIGSVLMERPHPWVFVKIRTDEGIVGIGEAYHGAGVHQIIADERFQSLLIGEDPRNVAQLFHRMMRWKASYAGVIMKAISGVESALWDIVGQQAGIPIWQLLGGKFRDEIRMYNDCHAGAEETPEAYAAKAKEAEAHGFTAIKFDIDPLPSRRDLHNGCISARDHAHYVEIVSAIREALDPNTDLAIDAHWYYAPVDIIKVAQAFEALNLLWLEDPCPPENVEAMTKITASTSTPICTGENIYTRHGFRDLVQKQGADIISPDLAKAGGLLEGRRIADLADLYYIPVAPHNIGSPIETMGTCHVMATIPNFLVLEFHHLDEPLWNALIHEPPLIENGYIRVPDTPGLGVTLNEEVVREHMTEEFGFFID